MLLRTVKKLQRKKTSLEKRFLQLTSPTTIEYSIHTTVTIHRHWSPDRDRILKKRKDHNIKAMKKDRLFQETVLRDLVEEESVASAAKALRFERSSDPEEPATRKARRGPSRFSFSLAFFLVLFSLRALCVSLLLLLSSRLPLCPSRGVTAPCRTRGAHSSPILRIALYFLCLALYSILLLRLLRLRRRERRDFEGKDRGWG